MSNETQMTVTIDRLIGDKANVRKHGAAAEEDASLAATIAAHGLLQPLLVRPPLADDSDLEGTRYRVTDGKRRFAAIAKLIEDKTLGADFAIPIMIKEDTGDADAGERSLVANLARSAMTVVDMVKAFKDLADAGSTPAEIAFRFGITERLVRSRMALADLHPDIIAAFDAGKINLEAAKAYTLGTQEEQARYFGEVQEWARNDSRAIKQAMTKEAIRNDSTMAVAIGREAYEAAGGVVVENLFGDDSYWESVDILASLKADKIAAIKTTKLAEGWSWCETIESLGVERYWDLPSLNAVEVVEATPEQQARMEEIADAMEAIEEEHGDDPSDEVREEYHALEREYNGIDRETKKRAFTDDQKARSGVVIEKDLSVHEGKLRPGEDAGEGGRAGNGAGAKVKVEKDPLLTSEALRERLSVAATQAAREAVLKNEHVALALVVTAMNRNLHRYGAISPSTIRLNGQDRSGEDAMRTFSEIFADNLKMEREDMIAELVTFASMSIDITDKAITTQSYSASIEVRDELRKSLLEAAGAQPLAHFDSRDFFSSSNKEVIKAAMEEMGEKLMDGKKASLVDQAEAFAQRYGWLPKELRLSDYKLNKPEPTQPKATAKADAKTSVDVTKGMGKEPAAKPKGAKAIKLDMGVISMLADDCRLEGHQLFIERKLERPDYDALNKVIKALGGKWVRHAGAHVFEDDPADMINEVLLTGQYSRTKQDFGQFDTPDDVAQLAVDWAEIEEGMSVLEPSVGIGNIAVKAIRKGGWVTAVEIDRARADKFENLVQGMEEDAADYVGTHVEDFMMWDIGDVYDRVVMNPPFAGQADIDHVTQAFDLHLAPGGILVAIMSNSFTFRTNKKSVDFRQLLEDHEASIENIEAGAFKESGTMIPTVMVKIRKPM